MSVNGIYGLSGSGIDVESMVRAGMLTKQSQYDKMYKKEIKNTWIKSEYSDFYSSMYTFKYTTMSNYKMQSTMSAMKASSSDSTTVSATANGAAASMSHKVSVSSLASNAYLLSTKAVTRANSTQSSSINLKDEMFSAYSVDTSAGTCSVTLNGEVKTPKLTDTALSFTVGDAASYTYNDKTYTADQVTVNTDGTYTIKNSDGTVAGTNVAAADVTLTDNSKTVSYTYADLLSDNKTFNDLASDINATGSNVTARYDSTTDSFSLYNSTGGVDNAISLKAADDGAAMLLTHLNLGATDGTTQQSAKTFTKDVADVTAGVNGKVTIDGKTYDNVTGSKMTVDGVSYTFNAVTSSAVTVAVSQDTDTIVANVKQFVTDYNKMLDSLNDKYYETAYSDYQPLTKSQESAMTTTQVSEWNEKAKSGLLYHDSHLRTIVSSMREAIYTPVDSVESEYNSASAIGITTENNKGHLKLDEDKLKEALAADPDCVYQIFASSQDDSTTSTDQTVSSYVASNNYRNTGIANRLYDVMTTSMSTISDYAGTTDDTDDQSYLGTLITNLQTKMSSFKTQMDAYEDLLYSKYDAMETAIASLSSQLSSITGSNS